MKVLLVCSKYLPEYAGAGLRIHRTYARLRARAAVDVGVVCSSMQQFSFRNDTYQHDGVEVVRVSSPFKRRLIAAAGPRRRWQRACWHLLAAIDESVRTAIALRRHRDVDVVHTVGHCWSAAVAAIWAAARGKRIIREMVTMQSRPDDPPGVRWLVRRALHSHGTIIAISPRLAERARGLGYTRVWCRPNPVDTERFRIDRGRRVELRRRYTSFGADDVVLVDLSKYSRVKNKALAIHGLALLPSRFKLVVAGPLEPSDRPIFDELQHLVRSLKLEARVVLQHGFVDQPEHYYQFADVFLFPSISDGLGTPVLEAIACGVPVVAHRLPGVTDAWLQEGRSGVLCEATPEAFAASVVRALEIPPHEVMQAAEALRRVAGAETVDAGYLSLLQHDVLPAA